jgi:quercetin dioxygenase-like cupin family protein
MYPSLIYHDKIIHVVELHFEPGGEMWEHEADHPTLFMVIDGKGWVRVDGKEAELQAGQAVLWPANKMHKAWAKDVSFTAIALEYDFSKET